jgi:hypothetical protein
LVLGGEAVALLADAELFGGGDVPGLELSACPGVAAFALGRVEGFGFGVLAVALEVVAVAEDPGAVLSAAQFGYGGAAAVGDGRG